MIAVPHCEKCGEQLEGNGSYHFPYRCSCGKWEYNYATREYYFK